MIRVAKKTTCQRHICQLEAGGYIKADKAIEIFAVIRGKTS